MKHLEDEDIARLIEGNVGKEERERFLKHLSECDACLGVYTETLKIFQDEFTDLKVIDGSPRPRYSSHTLFKPFALAASVLILITLSFVLYNIFSNNIKKVKIQHLLDSYAETGVQAFTSHGDEISAAVRVGIFSEDMTLLIDVSSDDPLKAKVSRLLGTQLEVLDIDREPADIDGIRQTMEGYKLSRLFRFGCFVERTILSTFENKLPRQADIETYRQIAASYHLPPGVLKSLDKLNPGASIEQIRDACKNIKDIFLALE